MGNRTARIVVALVTIVIAIIGIYSYTQPSSFPPSPADQTPITTTPLPLNGLTPGDPAAIISGDNPATITTPPMRYAYAAILKIPTDLKSAGRAWVKIAIKVKQGKFAISLLSDDAQKIVTQQVFSVTPNIINITFFEMSLTDVGLILFSNSQDVDGTASVAELSSVKISYNSQP